MLWLLGRDFVDILLFPCCGGWLRGERLLWVLLLLWLLLWLLRSSGEVVFTRSNRRMRTAVAGHGGHVRVELLLLLLLGWHLLIWGMHP